MANFLFCWELGGGLGHVTPLAPFAAELLRRGHRVLVAVRDVHAAHQAFSPSAIAFVAAPYKTGVRQRAIQRPRSYAHILHNNGFADANELAGLTAAWRNLYHQFQPHVIAFNHRPTALLAARGYPARRVLLGDGFCSPPPSTPLPIIRPWIKHDVPRLARDDEIIAGVANAALTALRLPALGQLSDLYREVDENFLLTYAELDHFGPRQGATYHGVFNTCPGAPPRWPVEGTRRVFAYLKPTPAMPQVLRAIAGTGCRLIVHGTWVRGYLAAEEPRFANIALMPTPVDLGRVLADCDAAILNATHGTTAAALQADLAAPHRRRASAGGPQHAAAGRGTDRPPRPARGNRRAADAAAGRRRILPRGGGFRAQIPRRRFCGSHRPHRGPPGGPGPRAGNRFSTPLTP
jgi:UDP:flavonoid glycosyltransferase YjiC (YdhE family)